jgi:hypothetical protein
MMLSGDMHSVFVIEIVENYFPNNNWRKEGASQGNNIRLLTILGTCLVAISRYRTSIVMGAVINL